MPKTTSHTRIDNDLLQQLAGDLSGSELKLLLVLQSHADKSGRAFPGVRRLAQLLKCTERHIRRLKARLVELGLLLVNARFTAKGRQRSNSYLIQPLHNRAADTAGRNGTKQGGGHHRPAMELSEISREIRDKAKAILRSNGVVNITRETLAWQIVRM